MEHYIFNKQGNGYQLYRKNDRIGDTYAKLASLTDETDPNEKYAKEAQMQIYQGIYKNKYKQQLTHKKDFLLNEISQSMSSSVPSYTFDQVFYFNQRTALNDSPEEVFELDQTFMNIDTDYKTIGLREIRVIPESYRLKFKISYEYGNDQNNDPANPHYDTESVEIEIQVTALNHIEEIVFNILKQFNRNEQDIILESNYISETNNLVIAMASQDGAYTYQFRFISDFDAMGNLLHLFNLPIIRNGIIPYLSTIKEGFDFENVWDRRSLCVHSTIPNTTPYNY
jgi:hypothetical protein